MTNFRTLAFGAVLALAYVVTANLGFRVAFVAEQVTTVPHWSGRSRPAE